MPDALPKPEFSTGASAISTERIELAIMQRYSPMPELTMPSLVSRLNQFRIGELRPAARMWEIMLERDGDLSVPAEKLFSDVARLPWDIEREDDSKEADQDYALLKYFYTHLTATSVLDGDETGGINLLVRQMMTAHALRYSAHEILLRINNAARREITAEFRHAPLWFFGARRGRLEYLARDGEIYGEALAPGKWLAAIGRGMMRPCSVAYFTKWGPLADNMFFAKRFGLPAIHGETTAGEGTAEWNAFEEALLAFSNGWIMQTSGLGSSKINLIEASKGGSGTLPFKELIDRADRVYARCFRGGDLSTQSRDGGQVAGANPQESEKDIVLEDGGQWATDVLNARVDEPLVAYAYNRAPKAWIVIRPPKRKDSAAEINRLNAARQLNVPVSIDTARERLELPAPEDGAELIVAATPPSPNPNPALANEDTRRAALTDAFNLDLQPVRAELAAILQIEDAALKEAKLRAFLDRIEQLKRDLPVASATQRTLAQMIGSDLAAAVAKKPITK